MMNFVKCSVLRVFLALVSIAAAHPAFCADLRVIIEFDGPPAMMVPAAKALDKGGQPSVAATLSVDSLEAARKQITSVHDRFLASTSGLVRPIPRPLRSNEGPPGPMMKAATEKTGEFKRITDIFNGLAAVVSEDDLPALRSMPGVKAIYPDKVVSARLTESVPITGADDVWNLTDQSGATVRGTGIRVAILDTGIDYTHPDLGGGFGPSFKVAGGYDFVNYDFDPRDDNGHGTHVAGIIAASGKMTGVAPGATLMAYKVLDNSGSGYSSDVVSAIGKAASDGADIINISLGTMDDTPLTTAAENAVALGVVVCAAAGNEGPTIRTINSPGDGPNVISVAACEKSLTIWYGSSRGPTSTGLSKPDITAPGKSIRSTYSGGTYAYLTGTSMACPHVTGVCALILQASPTLDPAGVRKRLYDNAIDLGYAHTTQGYGLVDAKAAVLDGKVNQPPALTILTPAAQGETVDQLAFITWSDSDPDSSASIALYRDDDASGFDGVAIASGISEDSVENQYIWNTSGVPEGLYYIYGVISDGVNSALKSYAPGSFRVLHPPSITVETPLAAGETAWSTYVVRWADNDSDDNALIRFYADNDKFGYDGVLLPGEFREDPDEDGDTATLDISALPSGVYYIYAAASDGHNSTSYSYAPGPLIVNSPPSFDFVSPPGGTVIFARDGWVEVTIHLHDPDNDARAALFIDSDDFGFDGTPVTGLLTETPDPMIFTFNMSDVPSGEYRIYSEAIDGVNPAVRAYAPWTVIRNDPPAVAFLSPILPETLVADALTIGYSLTDADSTATATVFAFPEEDPSMRSALSAVPLGETSDGEFLWNLSGWTSGRYGLVIVATDGMNAPVETVSPGIVVIDHLPIVTFPNDGANSTAVVFGATFEVLALATDTETATPSVVVFWDSDPLGFDGTPLVSAEGKPSVFSTVGITVDRFWVYALADDGVNLPTGAYATPAFFMTRVGTISEVRLSNLASDRAAITFRTAETASPLVEYRIISPTDPDANGPTNGAIIRASVEKQPAAGIFEAELTSLVPASSIGARLLIPTETGEICFPAHGEIVFTTPGIEMHSVSANFRARVANPLNSVVFIEQTRLATGSARFSSVLGKPDSEGNVSIPIGPFFDETGVRRTPAPGEIVRATIVSATPFSSKIVEFSMPELGADADVGFVDLVEKDFQPVELVKGWNLVSISVYPDPVLTAGEFLEKTGAIMVAAWDAGNQSYKAVFQGDSGFVGTDFSLLPGAGFFVKVPGAVRLVIPGKKPEKPLAMAFSKGFNLVGSARPSGLLGGGTAGGLLGYDPGNIAVFMWDSVSQSYGLVYKTVDPLGQISVIGRDLSIVPGLGFFVKATSLGYYLDE